MRKLIVFIMASLDGYFEGEQKELDWHNVDDEFNQFAIEQLNSVDLLLFGRVTYQLMESYWPTERAKADDPLVAMNMNAKSKIVFSRKLSSVHWNNTRLIKENVEEEVLKLKQQPGKDLLILGSSNLCVSFIKSGLIDEVRIIINPVVLGKGHTIFNGIKDKLTLKLQEAKCFRSGNVLLKYAPVTGKHQ